MYVCDHVHVAIWSLVAVYTSPSLTSPHLPHLTHSRVSQALTSVGKYLPVPPPLVACYLPRDPSFSCLSQSICIHHTRLPFRKLEISTNYSTNERHFSLRLVVITWRFNESYYWLEKLKDAKENCNFLFVFSHVNFQHTKLEVTNKGSKTLQKLCSCRILWFN